MTSLRRCKIPLSVLQDSSLIFNGSEIQLNIDKAVLKDYFSRSLWDSIEKLDLLILNYHDYLYGLLILINSSASNSNSFSDFAFYFTKKTSELFYNSKSKVINSLTTSSEPEPAVRQSELSEIIEKKLIVYENTDFSDAKIIYIDYEEMLESVCKRNNSIDTYRIENDLYTIFSAMLFGKSLIVRMVESKIILIFLSGLTSNNLIIKNQMLSNLFSIFDINLNHQTPKPHVFVEDLNCNLSELPSAVIEFINAR